MDAQPQSPRLIDQRVTRAWPARSVRLAWVVATVLACALPASIQAKGTSGVLDTILDEVALDLSLPPGKAARNGSLVRYRGQLVLAYRLDHEDTMGRPWMEIAVVELDEQLRPAGPVSLFDARTDPHLNPTAEDPRILCHNDRLFVAYNSTMDGNVIHTSRQMHLAELRASGRPGNKRYGVVRNKQLSIAGAKTNRVEKNWTPFSYQGQLHFVYTTNPPHVLKLSEAAWQQPDDVVALEPVSQLTKAVPSPFGEMRGGTPALYDAELDAYVSFHHARLELSDSEGAVTYFAGMYTFEAKPPFAIRQQVLNPIVPRGVYHDAEKRVSVTYPGGYVRDGDQITLLVGENDRRLNAIVLSYSQLKAALRNP